tara:strand:+ start:2424 stop:2801 length:378 start_codon:yes stop_codon:yes gene_type:complete
MAIKYKDMAIRQEERINTLKTAPFTDEELAIIKEVEDYIDGIILKIYEGWPIKIFLHYANFTTKVDLDSSPRTHNLNHIRRLKMYKELKNRYNEAGWNCREDLDDGLDGPNMSGNDYLVLTGKGR